VFSGGAHLEGRQGVGQLVNAAHVRIDESVVDERVINALEGGPGEPSIPASIRFALQLANGGASVLHDGVERPDHLVRDGFDLRIQLENAAGDVRGGPIAGRTGGFIRENESGRITLRLRERPVDGGVGGRHAYRRHPGRAAQTSRQDKGRDCQEAAQECFPEPHVITAEGRLFIIGQIVRVDSNIIGLGIVNKAHGLNVSETLQESLANAVHPIHYAAVTRKNDGKSGIAIKHQPRMTDNFTAG
jgi:hypothetical protein